MHVGAVKPAVSCHLLGEYACFSRPEMKVERVSYPMMTPAAARGAMEAILWKPQIAWLIERILGCGRRNSSRCDAMRSR